MGPNWRDPPDWRHCPHGSVFLVGGLENFALSEPLAAYKPIQGEMYQLGLMCCDFIHRPRAGHLRAPRGQRTYECDVGLAGLIQNVGAPKTTVIWIEFGVKKQSDK